MILSVTDFEYNITDPLLIIPILLTESHWIEDNVCSIVVIDKRITVRLVQADMRYSLRSSKCLVLSLGLSTVIGGLHMLEDLRISALFKTTSLSPNQQPTNMKEAL